MSQQLEELIQNIKAIKDPHPRQVAADRLIGDIEMRGYGTGDNVDAAYRKLIVIRNAALKEWQEAD